MTLTFGEDDSTPVTTLTGTIDQAGAVVAEWSGPNDGHAGDFADPRCLALAPDGSILVADGGNARVVAIQGVFPRNVYLPLLPHRAP